jgi:hypothetical protein
LGVLEAMDAAYSIMKDPRDIMLIDLDNQGKWKIIPKDQLAKLAKKTTDQNHGFSVV